MFMCYKQRGTSTSSSMVQMPTKVQIYKRNRHIAYRQFVRWCWGFLGREIRVLLPSCAAMCIRQHFPAPGPEEDFVFFCFLLVQRKTLFSCIQINSLALIAGVFFFFIYKYYFLFITTLLSSKTC